MQHLDPISARNASHWEAAVADGTGHSLPWLDLDPDVVRRYVEEGSPGDKVLGRREPRRMVNQTPGDLRALGTIAGKDLLCLSCGGGQQSALFSLLGARVTVVDFAEGQLQGDREAATHYGYEITAIQGDMRDLSFLQEGSFDLVFGMTTCYVPSIREVYAQVARVLRPGGRYRTDVSGSAGSIRPGSGSHASYASTEIRQDYGGVHEFIHYTSDIIEGLADLGLRLLQVDDGDTPISPTNEVLAGDWASWPEQPFKILAERT